MFRLFAIIALTLMSTTTLSEEFENPDPLEDLNRGIWGFNDIVINSVGRPVVNLYENVTCHSSMFR